MTHETSIARLADALASERHVVALTGAGISTESGIPDFRSAGGLWERFDPFDYAHIDSFRAHPERVWAMLKELRAMVVGAQPNLGHIALAELEHLGVLDGVITQNIDGLHQVAGSKRVVEFHGSGDRLTCLECHAKYGRDEYDLHDIPPRCRSCDAILKPDAVLFGEMIPTHALRDASGLVAEARIVLVIGTSAEVSPASDIPWAARRSGARVFEVNLEPTAIAALAEDSLLGPAGETLPELVRQVRRRLQDHG